MLTKIPITTRTHVETLRKIRNACRATLRDTREISAEEQAEWWASVGYDSWRGWLFSVGETIVGAGHYRLDKDQWFATIMVMPEHRGRGVGTAIYRRLGDGDVRPVRNVWALIREDNQASKRAADKAGWMQVAREWWGFWGAEA